MKVFRTKEFKDEFIEKRNRTESEDLMHLVIMYRLEGEIRRFVASEDIMEEKELAVATLRKVCKVVASKYCYFDDRCGNLLFLERDKTYSCGGLLEPEWMEQSAQSEQEE